MHGPMQHASVLPHFMSDEKRNGKQLFRIFSMGRKWTENELTRPPGGAHALKLSYLVCVWKSIDVASMTFKFVPSAQWNLNQNWFNVKPMIGDTKFTRSQMCWNSWNPPISKWKINESYNFLGYRLVVVTWWVNFNGGNSILCCENKTNNQN